MSIVALMLAKCLAVIAKSDKQDVPVQTSVAQPSKQRAE